MQISPILFVENYKVNLLNICIFQYNQFFSIFGDKKLQRNISPPPKS